MASPGGIVLSEHTLLEGQTLKVLQGDLSQMSCDAVVHPTSGSMEPTGQVGSALVKVGGDSLRQEIKRLVQSRGNLQVTEAALCPSGGGLEAANVIHVFSPSWGNSSSKDQLSQAIVNCLKEANRHNVETLAFPSIGSGGNGFPKVTAARTIMRTLRKYFSCNVSSVDQIYFVLYDQESLGVYKTELGRLKMDGEMDSDEED